MRSRSKTETALLCPLIQQVAVTDCAAGIPNRSVGALGDRDGTPGRGGARGGCTHCRGGLIGSCHGVKLVDDVAERGALQVPTDETEGGGGRGCQRRRGRAPVASSGEGRAREPRNKGSCGARLLFCAWFVGRRWCESRNSRGATSIPLDPSLLLLPLLPPSLSSLSLCVLLSLCCTQEWGDEEERGCEGLACCRRARSF